MNKLILLVNGIKEEVSVEEGQNAKEIFFERKKEIIAAQKINLHDAFIISDNIVYEISPSLDHKKITGDRAKEVKRLIKNLN